jgi:hypothetical protein
VKTSALSRFVPRGSLAYTLVEIMTATSVFLLLMTAIIYTYIFALNLHETDKIKLGASDDARKAIIGLVDQIRSANKIRIGEGNVTNFVECATNGIQQGNAIQICPTNTNTIWLQYYYETNSGSSNYSKLLFTSYTNPGQYSLVIGHSMTNAVPLFSSEDSYGNVLSNDLNNRVIGMYLQFFQIEYPVVNIGPTDYYQYYQLHTRVTRRMIY